MPSSRTRTLPAFAGQVTVFISQGTTRSRGQTLGLPFFNSQDSSYKKAGSSGVWTGGEKGYFGLGLENNLHNYKEMWGTLAQRIEAPPLPYSSEQDVLVITPALSGAARVAQPALKRSGVTSQRCLSFLDTMTSGIHLLPRASLLTAQRF